MAKEKENRLVVGDAAWADTIPEWLLEEVKAERMIYGLACLMDGARAKVGDAEVTVYLMTASHRGSLSSEHTNIYMYLVTQLFKKDGKEVPEDIRKEKLTEWEEHELQELRDMIYDKRGGEIHHPVLDAMRVLKKEAGKQAKKLKGQLTLFE